MLNLPVLGVLFAGLIIGFFVGRGWALRAKGSSSTDEAGENLDLPPRLDRDMYLSRREYNDRRYLDSIRDYDRLIIWGGGGALVLSITFLEKIVSTAPEHWVLLGLSWTALLVAVLANILSQYTSAHMSSWRIRQLDHEYKVPENLSPGDAKKTWRIEQASLERRMRRWGKATAVLNPISGFLLVLGIAALALFAYLNPPIAK